MRALMSSPLCEAQTVSQRCKVRLYFRSHVKGAGRVAAFACFALFQLCLPGPVEARAADWAQVMAERVLLQQRGMRPIGAGAFDGLEQPFADRLRGFVELAPLVEAQRQAVADPQAGKKADLAEQARIEARRELLKVFYQVLSSFVLGASGGVIGALMAARSRRY